MSQVALVEEPIVSRALLVNRAGVDDMADVSDFTETEYRAIKRISYSSLKEFIDDRMSYRDRHEFFTKKAAKSTSEMNFGTLVETLLWDEKNYSAIFEESTVPKPTGQMGDLIDKMSELYDQSVDEDGVVTRDFTEVFEEAFNSVAFDGSGNQIKFKKKSVDDVFLKWKDSAAEQYFEEACNSDKILLDLKDKVYGDRCVQHVRNHWVTLDLVNRKSDSRYDVYHQVIVLYTYNGIRIKSKIDMLVVDHHLRQIFIYDLKTTFDVEEFDFRYRQLRYYIQGYLYWIAAMHWAIKNGLRQYEVNPMEFIVVDSKARMAPLIRVMKKRNMKEAREGFSYQGKHFKGVDQALEALKWHRETNIWEMSKANYVRHGRIGIKVYEDEKCEVNKHHIIPASGAGIE